MMQRYTLSEETNVARLGLISVMKNRPADPEFDTGWTAELTIGNIPGTIKCRTQADLGIPHGIDNDVSTAIHTKFLKQGCPENGRVTFTLAEILEMIGINATPRTYARVMESIKRLHMTHYEIEAHWFNADRKISGSTAFTYLSNYSVVHTEHLFNPNQQQTNITVTLNDQIRSNLELQHLITLKPEYLKALAPHGPTVRATYRLLQSVIHDPRNITISSNSLRLSTKDLQQLGRILTTDDRPSRIIRIFEQPLEQLKQIGYIEKFDITKGKGESYIDLQFPQIETVFSPEAFKLLTEAGVWERQAREFAGSKSIDQIEATISYTQSATSIKDKGAMIAKMLRDDAVNLQNTKTSIPKLIKKTKSKTSTPVAEEPIEITQKSAPFYIGAIAKDISPPLFARLHKLVKEVAIPSDEIRALIADPSDDAVEQFIVRYTLFS